MQASDILGIGALGHQGAAHCGSHQRIIDLNQRRQRVTFHNPEDSVDGLINSVYSIWSRKARFDSPSIPVTDVLCY